jgi:hypothetical protein
MLLASISLMSNLEWQYGIASISAFLGAFIPGILMRNADV